MTTVVTSTESLFTTPDGLGREVALTAFYIGSLPRSGPRTRALVYISLVIYRNLVFKWRSNPPYPQNNGRKLREQERRHVATRSFVNGFSTSVSKKFIGEGAFFFVSFLLGEQKK